MAKCIRSRLCVGQTSLSGDDTHRISMSNNKLQVTRGPNFLAGIDLCGLQYMMKQYWSGTIVVPAGKENVPLQYSHALGKEINLFVAKVRFDAEVKEDEDKTLSWHFKSSPDCQNPIYDHLLLTGTSVHPVGEIMVNNKTPYDVSIDVLAATNSVVMASQESTSATGESIITDLSFRDILADHGFGSDIIIYKNSLPYVYVNNQNLENIEKSGKTIYLDDRSEGIIRLEFKTEYDANQAWSLLNWYISDSINRSIKTTTATDDIGPSIGLVNTDDLEFILSGTGAGYITKQDLIDKYVGVVYDDRDGEIIMNFANVSITDAISGMSTNAIDRNGKYVVEFRVFDLAGNQSRRSLVIDAKTGVPPKVIVKPWVAQALSSGIQSQEVYLQDYTLGSITKQNLIDLLVQNIIDDVDSLDVNVQNIQVEVTAGQASGSINEISEPGNYIIKLVGKDFEGNESQALWESLNQQLIVNGSPVLTIPLTIKTNDGPYVVWSELEPVYNLNFFNVNGIITKNDLLQELVDQVLDDRDESSEITFVSFGLVKTANLVGGSYVPIIENEVDYISTTGEYRFTVQHKDADDHIGVDSILVKITN